MELMMPQIKKLVLDVLKPHQPDVLEFSAAIAAVRDCHHVQLKVIEVDENTETVAITVHGEAINFESLQVCITELGGSLHSIDEVEVQANNGTEPSSGS